MRGWRFPIWLKLFLIFVGLAFVATTIAQLFNYQLTRQSFIEAEVDDLAIINGFQQRAIGVYSNDSAQKVLAVASAPDFVTALRSLNGAESDEEYLEFQEAVNTYLLNEVVLRDNGLREVHIVNGLGDVIASSSDDALAMSLATSDLIREAGRLSAGEVTNFSVDTSLDGEVGSVVYLAAPVYAQAENTLVGSVVLFEFKSDALFLAVTGYAQSANTGFCPNEGDRYPYTYLVDSNGDIAIHSCAEDDDMRAYDPELWNACLLGRDSYGVFEGSSGDVILAARCLEQGGMLVTEIDAGSILRPLEQTQRRIVLGTALSGIVMSIALFFVIRSLLRPIRELSVATAAIEKGDYSQRVSEKGRDELSELKRAFNTMAASIQRLDEGKSSFVALASHQLSNPIALISWHAEALLTQEAGPLNEKQQVFAQEIQETAQHLDELIEQLMYVARLEMRTYVVERTGVEIEGLFKQIIGAYKRGIDAAQLMVELDIDKQVDSIYTDRQLLQMAIGNLVSNAVKYSNDGGKVVLRTRATEDAFIIEVRDQGVGIPEKDQEHIFERFFRASNVRLRRGSGTGLGLYIAQEAITVLGGTISFESEEGEGTVFTIQFPRDVILLEEERDV